MNKFLLIILLIFSSVTFADTISCPTSDLSVSGTRWKILFLVWKLPDGCTGSPYDDASVFDKCQSGGAYYPYDYTSKTLDKSSATFNSMQYSYNNAYISSQSNSAAKTLICEGTYEGKSTKKYLGFNWSNRESGLMRAELVLPTEYTSCAPALNKNGQSFECKA